MSTLLLVLRHPSLWPGEITYLAYRSGLRSYCHVHDTLRWAWTHRRCCASQYRHREVQAIIRHVRRRDDP